MNHKCSLGGEFMLIIFHIIVLANSYQTDKEYQEMYMTHRVADHGNYTKVFDRSPYSAYLPDSVDWRTSNAVTSIKYQVHTS